MIRTSLSSPGAGIGDFGKVIWLLCLGKIYLPFIQGRRPTPSQQYRVSDPGLGSCSSVSIPLPTALGFADHRSAVKQCWPRSVLLSYPSSVFPALRRMLSLQCKHLFSVLNSTTISQEQISFTGRILPCSTAGGAFGEKQNRRTL